MKQLIRKLSRVSDSSSSSYILLRPDASAPKRKGRKHSPDDGSFTSASVKRVPGGYLPVVVGEEMERFLVRRAFSGSRAPRHYSSRFWRISDDRTLVPVLASMSSFSGSTP